MTEKQFRSNSEHRPHSGYLSGTRTVSLYGSMEEIVACIDKCYASKNGKPKCLYAHTVKGKGVSFMENQCGWHGVAPNDEQYVQAMAELKAQLID